MLLGAAAVLTLGAAGVSAAPSDAPPCHQGAGERQPAPGHAPKPMKAMICCVACVSTPVPEPVDAPRFGVVARPAQPALSALPSGRRLTPEPGPPRFPIV